MKDFSIKLDCPLGDAAAKAEHANAVAFASALHSSYLASKETLIGTGPELFAEQWIFNFVVFSTEEFDNLIMTYFVKILWSAQNG